MKLEFQNAGTFIIPYLEKTECRKVFNESRSVSSIQQNKLKEPKRHSPLCKSLLKGASNSQDCRVLETQSQSGQFSLTSVHNLDSSR